LLLGGGLLGLIYLKLQVVTQ